MIVGNILSVGIDIEFIGCLLWFLLFWLVYVDCKSLHWLVVSNPRWGLCRVILCRCYRVPRRRCCCQLVVIDIFDLARDVVYERDSLDWRHIDSYLVLDTKDLRHFRSALVGSLG